MSGQSENEARAIEFAKTREEINAAKGAFLLEQLYSSRSRITELENRQIFLEKQLDHIQQKIKIHSEQTINETSGDLIFASVRMQRVFSLLDLVQRRDAWLQLATSVSLQGQFYSLYPHDAQPSRLSMLVCGSGGFGDILYLSMICRALWARFNRPRIFVVHEHPGVCDVLEGNPFIVQSMRLDGPSIRRLVDGAGHLDVFDLIADVRYAVTFAEPPNSRIDYEFFLNAATRSRRYQKYTRGLWPFINNDFAAEVTTQGFNKYSLALHTANLEPVINECGDLWIYEDLKPAVVSELAKPYVTMHHGADRFMAGTSGLQTKNLPEARWEELVRRVKRSGLAVVQIGEEHEKSIEGVDVNLLGKLSFKESAEVMRFAQAHVDTEGGMVHAAAAVGTQSVVMFGPTPAAFFGYPYNVNLAPQECGDCWWTTRTWAQECPRAELQPPCMNSHDPSVVAKSVLSIASRQLTIQAERVHLVEGEGFLCLLQAASAASATRPGLVVISDAVSFCDLPLVDHLRRTKVHLRVLDTLLPDLPDAWSTLDPLPATRNRVLAKSGECSWALIDQTNQPPSETAAWIYELARCVGSGGRIFVATDASTAKGALMDIIAAIAALPGGRLAPAAGSIGSFSTRQGAGRALLELSIGEQQLANTKTWSALPKALFSREK